MSQGYVGSSEFDIKYSGRPLWVTIDKSKKLVTQMKFPKILEQSLDISKVNMDVMRPWISDQFLTILGFDDDIIVELACSLLEAKTDAKQILIQLTGFLEAATFKFMKELWILLLSAQEQLGGIPEIFLQRKKEEILAQRVRDSEISDNLKKHNLRNDREHSRSPQRGSNAHDRERSRSPRRRSYAHDRERSRSPQRRSYAHDREHSRSPQRRSYTHDREHSRSPQRRRNTSRARSRHYSRERNDRSYYEDRRGESRRRNSSREYSRRDSSRSQQSDNNSRGQDHSERRDSSEEDRRRVDHTRSSIKEELVRVESTRSTEDQPRFARPVKRTSDRGSRSP